jgi:diketogulonate reductase-like aldo/keto reductase
MKENTQIFDFEISKDDMERINAMPYCGGSGNHPDEIDF